MTHPMLILKGMTFPTIHIHTPSPRNALTKRYEFWHYRSFVKVNKNTFWVKASYMNVEDSIDMRPKGFLRVHLKLSKKSKNTVLGSKLMEICIVKVGYFWKFSQSQQCPKSIFLQMGQTFYAWILFLIWSKTHKPLHT